MSKIRRIDVTCSSRSNERHFAGKSFLLGLLLAALILPVAAGAQALRESPQDGLPNGLTDAESTANGWSGIALTEAPAPVENSAPFEGSGSKTKSPKQPVASDLTVFGMDSYGNWQIFAAGIWEHLWTAGVEYDRNTWGRFAGARMDWAAEVIPVVLLRQPAKLNPYGVRDSHKNIIVPGAGISPIGLRMLWRANKAVKPYFTVKGGVLGFTQKALSPDATYFNFSMQEAVGIQLKLKERWDLRLGVFGDFHFSNAFITQYNPGLDVMNSSVGLTYHFKS